MQKSAPIILRVGLALVVIWFGIAQLLNPAFWTGYLPAWTTSLPISAVTFVLLNAWLECTLGLFLVAGFYTRLAALVLSLHLYGIVFTLGYNAVGVRDFGLATALLSIFLFGPDAWSADDFLSKKSPVGQ